MKIRILTVGKIKEKFYRDAIAEYQKRLGRYCKLEIVEVADEKTDENASPSQMEQVKEKEGQRLLSHIRDGEYCIVLAIEGKKLDSVAFSQQIDRLMVSGTSTIDFVIGRVPRTVQRRPFPRGFSPELFRYDLPASAHARHFAGTGLPRVPDFK